MKFYKSLKDCKANNPRARWFYSDRNGVGGQTRWYASVRILKKAQEQLERHGYSPESAWKHGFTTFFLL